MDTFTCIRAARSSLANAHRHLDSGQAINWVAGNISSAICWTMEGWLIANGHSINHGSGWFDTYQAFEEHAPDALNAAISQLYAQAVYLELALLGDNDTPPIATDAWLTKVRDCLDNAQTVVESLLTEIEP